MTIRVILADDQAMIRAGLRMILESDDEITVVAEAANGAEAIILSRREHPDLILMDVQMPGMDGIDAMRAIRADAPVAHIPIIALTALAMPGDEANCIAAGANGYLAKPVRLKQLVETIQELLASA